MRVRDGEIEVYGRMGGGVRLEIENDHEVEIELDSGDLERLVSELLRHLSPATRARLLGSGRP